MISSPRAGSLMAMSSICLIRFFVMPMMVYLTSKTSTLVDFCDCLTRPMLTAATARGGSLQ